MRRILLLFVSVSVALSVSACRSSDGGSSTTGGLAATDNVDNTDGTDGTDADNGTDDDSTCPFISRTTTACSTSSGPQGCTVNFKKQGRLPATHLQAVLCGLSDGERGTTPCPDLISPGDSTTSEVKEGCLLFRFIGPFTATGALGDSFRVLAPDSGSPTLESTTHGTLDTDGSVKDLPAETEVTITTSGNRTIRFRIDPCICDSDIFAGCSCSIDFTEGETGENKGLTVIEVL